MNNIAASIALLFSCAATIIAKKNCEINRFHLTSIAFLPYLNLIVGETPDSPLLEVLLQNLRFSGISAVLYGTVIGGVGKNDGTCAGCEGSETVENVRRK